jgi:hypothetical protein
MGFLLILILEIDYQLGFKMENKTFRLNSKLHPFSLGEFSCSSLKFIFVILV